MLIFVWAAVGVSVSLMKPQNMETSKPEVLSRETVTNSYEVESDIEIVWAKVGQRAVRLINNLEKKVLSAQLMDENKCTTGINGGYYGTDDKPQGWMVIEGKQISRRKTSLLMNGYVYTATGKTLYVSDRFPGEPVEYGLQSGPVLMTNGYPHKLSMARDKNARRMVVANSKSGEAFFISVYNPNYLYSGPMMVELPQLIKNLSDREHLDIVTAVNLDGGNASAFINDDQGNQISLFETTMVGSWWCVSEAE